MRFPRLRLRRRWVVWLLVPPALWMLLITLVPMGWARDRLVDRLSQATGQHVQLDALRIGFCGGVRLEHLAIGTTEPNAQPWFQVENLWVNVSLAHLLLGQCEPSQVNIEGLTLRMLRRRDGTLEFGSLLKTDTHPSVGSTRGGRDLSAYEPSSKGEACLLEFALNNARLSVIDEPSDTRLDLAEVAGHGSWDGRRGIVQDLHGLLNGGKFQLAAQYDRSTAVPSFDGQVRAEQVSLNESMGALSYLMPVLAGSPAEPGGRVDLNLYVRGQGVSRAEIAGTLVGRGAVAIDPLELDGSRLVAELTSALALAGKARVGSVHSEFTIGQGRITSDKLTVNLAQVPIVLSGWTDFDGRIDYRIRQEGLSSRLSQEAHDLLSDLPFDLDDLMALRVHGTLDALVVSVDSRAVESGARGDDSRQTEQRLRLRNFGRRLRDRILK